MTQSNNTIHDRDFQLWIEKTIQQLQNREFEKLDVEHLIEELRLKLFWQFKIEFWQLLAVLIFPIDGQEKAAKLLLNPF